MLLDVRFNPLHLAIQIRVLVPEVSYDRTDLYICVVREQLLDNSSSFSVFERVGVAVEE